MQSHTMYCNTFSGRGLPEHITGSFIISLVIGHKYSSGTPESVYIIIGDIYLRSQSAEYTTAFTEGKTS